jgi:carbamoyltransferase
MGHDYQGRGEENRVILDREIRFPHSLGMLYSAFTYYLRFAVNESEYKVMGLAPYGEPRFVNEIRDNLIDVKRDGSYKLRAPRKIPFAKSSRI